MGRNAANFTPLSPISHQLRSAAVYPDKPAVIHDRVYSYRELGERSRRLASALQARGLGQGDTISVMAPNIPAMLEAHYGIPMMGGVLNALNIRLDAATIAFILEHGESKALLTDREFAPVIEEALQRLGREILVIDIDDPLTEAQGAERGKRLGELTYEELLAEGDPGYQPKLPEDEWQAICLLYTSGTTGDPKGVVYHHRGAYLNALGNIVTFGLSPEAVYLWTLPMFHCDGWTYTWAVTAAAGTHVCLRRVDPALVFPMLGRHGVTHMCGAPIVRNLLISAPEEQGVNYVTLDAARVIDPETMREVPADGETLGEIMLRGNTVMKGYLKNREATAKAFAGGWFHSGDLAVMHPDGYIEVKDRSKDVIISGGENISSLEVEEALYRHPKVLEAAVVARPDEKWGETPCAFVTLKNGQEASAEEIIAYCREHMAHFKAPKSVVFGPLPKTSTGKIQKFVLREQAARL